MDDMFELIVSKQQNLELTKVLDCNQKSEKFGLVLSQAEANELMLNRKTSLKDSHRIEFGEGVLPKIIDYFCDSQYINQDSYVETLTELQDIFYTYKNETLDDMTDDELISFMRTQFDDVCFGDMEYLRNTCLERVARSTRSGYMSKMQSRLRDEYSLRKYENDFEDQSEETRWDYEVYKQSLEDQF
jgi:hypothetical protein